jgi:hypothetical protein
VDAAVRQAALEQAGVLRGVASQLNQQSIGGRWQSPARDQCEARLTELEAALLSSARRLENWAHRADIASVTVDWA